MGIPGRPVKVSGKIRAQALGQGIRWSHHPGTLIKVTETQKESHLPTIPFLRGFYSTYLSDLVYLPQPRHVKYHTVVQNHNIAVPVPRPIPVHLPFNNSLYTHLTHQTACLRVERLPAHCFHLYPSRIMKLLDTNRYTMYHCKLLIPIVLRCTVSLSNS